MTVKFTDEIELVIDDEKLIGWQLSNDKRYVMLLFKKENGNVTYEIDLKEKEIKKYSGYSADISQRRCKGR